MKSIFVFLAMIVLSTAAFGQTSRGVVSGSVVDGNRASIPGAEVVLVNTATSVKRTTVTNGEGFYRFDAVDLGIYSITVGAPNFGKLTRDGINVSANQTATADAELKPGDQQATVEVTAGGGDLLQTEASVRGGNISAKQITELPIGGNPVALALTLPGVSSNRSGVGVGSFSVNGARSRSNNFLIDGTENNDISVAGQGFQITNQDAVQEVSVQTSNFESEFGRAGGAVVNVITKSGTSKFAGTLGFEYDSSADDAITAAQSRNLAIVARGRQLSSTQFVPSATFGGPLFLPRFGEGGRMLDTSRDKNFFFVAYEETRFRQPGGSVTLNVPTAAGRARLQPFAATNPNVAIYLAATANTVAPTANLVAISLDNANLPPSQQTRGVVERGSFFREFSTRFTGKQFQIRTDHRLSSRDQLSFRFLSDVQDQPLGGDRNFEGFDSDFSANYKNFLIAESHVFSSTVTNELRLAYNLIQFGFPLADPDGPAGTLPTLNIAGFTALGAGGAFPQGRTANNYQFQDTVTKIAGNHTLRLGVDYLRQISTQIAPANIRGSLTYNAGGGFTSLGNFVDDFGGGNGVAQRFFGSQTYFPSLHRIAAFVQDRWKMTPDLTVTAGVRYENFGTPFNTLRTPAFTGLFNVDPVTRTGPFSEPNQVAADNNNFAPSVGLAYSPSFTKGIGGFLFGDRKTAFRMGFNMGFDSFFNNIASNAAASSPNGVVSQFNSVVSTANPRGEPNFTNQLPTTAVSVTAASAQTLIAPNLLNPYYQRWSFGLQRELPLNIIIDASYVGSKGTKLYINEDYNPTVRPELRITPLNPATGLPVTTGLTGRLDNIQGGRTVRTNGGSSTYHGAQVEARRRFGNNFQMTGAYTFSKLISNADEVFVTGLGNAGASFFSVSSLLGGGPNDRALSEFDRTHRASFTYLVQSPLFRNQSGFVGKLLGGYQIGGVTTFESGVPFTVFNGFDSDGNAGAGRPDFNPNGQRGVRAIPVVNANNVVTGYLNPEEIIGTTTAGAPIFAPIDPSRAQFIVLPSYVIGASGSFARQGSLGRNTERSRGINTTNLTLLKRTRIGEARHVDIRAEMFNAFNTPQFGSGNNAANEFSQGLFLQPVNPTTSGGGRTVRYQVKLVF